MVSVLSFEGKGGENVMLWIREVEMAMSSVLLQPEQQRVVLRSLSSAGERMSGLSRASSVDGTFPTWDELKEKLSVVFLPPNHVYRVRSRFLVCRQDKKNLLNFVQGLRTLIAGMFADSLPEAVTTTGFMDGLRTSVACTEVFRSRPASFEEAVAGKQLYTLFNGVTGELNGNINLDTLPSCNALLELDEMCLTDFGDALKACGLADVVMIRPEEQLNSSSVVDEAALEDTKKALNARSGSEILKDADVNGRDRAIAFESRQLKATEKNYPVHDKELLAMKYALVKFRVHLIDSKPFVVYTDHASLRTVNQSPHLSQRMARWLSFFAEYYFENLTLYEALDSAVPGHLGREKTYSSSMSMDFVFGLIKDSDGNAGVVVFVDQLSKMAHLAAELDTIDGNGTATLFLDRVFRQHGLPESVVYDRDPRFTSDFWQKVFEVLGTRLDTSTADHPQTDGQTERVNRVVEDMLRSTCTETPKRLSAMLPLVEFSLNNAVNASTYFNPFYVNSMRHTCVPLTRHDVTLGLMEENPTGWEISALSLCGNKWMISCRHALVSYVTYLTRWLKAKMFKRNKRMPEAGTIYGTLRLGIKCY
ncbi:reverse transcriptase [Phytophthora megakarya]|uniref:Reverse transcriptase n=1 Tax=Phytophthora megakarya TaxID=4795 RepID=A0A225VHM7_9STRA|nr:reverse transcriptase [Phytophthora megakarya]